MTAAHFSRQFTQPDMASEFRKNYTDQVVTVEMADHWLKHYNTRNRLFKLGNVEMYARDMKIGKWTQGSRLIFYSDGTLCDGQNRLLAVVKSGVSTFFDILVGATVEEGSNIDTGAKRSVSDALQVKGSPSWIANKDCVGIVNSINKLATHSSGIRLPHYIIENFAIENERWLRPAVEMAKAPKKKKLSACTYYATLGVALRANVSIDEILDFNQRYIHGENFDQSKCSVTRLREYVIGFEGQSWHFPYAFDTTKRTHRALQAFIARHPLSKLYAAPNYVYPFPTVLSSLDAQKLFSTP